MNRIIPIAALLSLSGCVLQRGDGIEETELRTVSTFDSVDNRGPFFMDVEMAEGEAGCSGELEVTCDSNLLDDVITEVKGGALIVRPPKGVNLLPRADCGAVVYACGSLRGVENSGSGSLAVYGAITGLETVSNSGTGDLGLGPATGTDLEVVNSGSGAIDLSSLSFESINLNNSGSGGASMSGAASQIAVHNSGSGDITARPLQTNTADIHNSGTGEVRLTVLDTCEIDISGSGDVEIWGGAMVSQQSSGTGQVIVH